MATPKFLFLLSLLLFSLLPDLNVATRMSGHHHGHHGHHHGLHHGFRPQKLFVFGDSYVDTGNIHPSLASSWKFPYGITFPGRPSGRFSDGRVSTDYLARFLGIRSPMPYTWRKIGYNKLNAGINFAFGGTGVFETLVSFPNMTKQIGFFKQLIDRKVYSPLDLHHSVALISVAGNDYATYIAKDGSDEGWKPFITKVVDQLELNAKAIRELGVRKIIIGGVQPLGCLPGSTADSSFQECDEERNKLASFHNDLLQKAVDKLNDGVEESPFVIIDLFKAFSTVIKNKGAHPGSLTFENPLKPCCIGVSAEFSCGSIDAKGTKKHTVCDRPSSTLFWDEHHPTQAGWQAAYAVLQEDLKTLF